MSSKERNRSSNGSSNMNALSPEVSLGKVDSSVGVEPQASGSQSSSTKPTQNTSPRRKTNGNGDKLETNFKKGTKIASMSFVNRTVGGSMKLGPKDNVTITVEDGSLPSEPGEDIEASGYGESYMGIGDESPSGRKSRMPGIRSKRPSSSSFNPYSKPDNGSFGENASKRRRVASMATNAFSSMDDPIGFYLAEMVGIGRQRLEMEQKRVENARAVRKYMMQLLQAILCPSQLQEENTNGDDEGNDAEDNAFAEMERKEDQSEDNGVSEMIEQEENQNQEVPPDEEQDNTIELHVFITSHSLKHTKI